MMGIFFQHPAVFPLGLMVNPHYPLRCSREDLVLTNANMAQSLQKVKKQRLGLPDPGMGLRNLFKCQNSNS